MTETNHQPQQLDPEELIRVRVFERVKAINTKLVSRLGTLADDLESGSHCGALGGLDGIEREIDTMRSFLLLLR